MTRSLSSNLIKSNNSTVSKGEKRIIDTNSLMTKKMEILKDILGDSFEQIQPDDLSEQITDGLDRQQVSELLGNTSEKNIEAITKEAEEEAEQIIKRAEAQAEVVKQLAQEEADKMREEAYDKGKDEGYNAGYAEGAQRAGLMEQAVRKREASVKEHEQALIAEYNKKLNDAEPELVDTLTHIYEHVFHVSFSEDREIIIHLLDSALRKTEGGRDFIVHVGKEDYPFISMQKKVLLQCIPTQNSTLEIIEDLTLKQNQCLIETDGGIFDCSLETQLTELGKKLRLLSYEYD